MDSNIFEEFVNNETTPLVLDADLGTGYISVTVWKTAREATEEWLASDDAQATIERIFKKAIDDMMNDESD